MITDKNFHRALLLARIVLGVVIFAHGAQKLFGWFGGYGFTGTMGFFTETIGLPSVLAFLIIIEESLGMLALIFGLLSRVVSVALIIGMMGAVYTSHLRYGFFMNWFGALIGEGYEFHLLAIALAAVIALNGPGKYSFDFLLLKRWKERNK